MTDGCVQFNKNSWHYKITHFIFPSLFWHDGVNLCPYMRAVVASILLLPFIYAWRKLPCRVQDYSWLIQAELIFFSLVLLASFLIDYVDPLAKNPNVFPPFLDLVAYGFIGGNIVGIVGGLFIFGVYSLTEYIKGRPKKEHKTRGLLKTYMESKHDKICPCVEFVDDDSN